MGIRFESNFQRITGVTPVTYIENDPLQRWFRVHEWQVDSGFQGNLLMVMLNVEPSFPTPATIEYGMMRVSSLLDTTVNNWETKFEVKMIGGSYIGKMFTPRLIILPIGSGINFTAGQGLMTTAFAQSSSTSFRWWSCYVIDANVV